MKTNQNKKLTSRDEIFKQPRKRGDFQFNSEVVAVFDDMVARSIPVYHEITSFISRIILSKNPPHGIIYDLGCSTGNLATAIQNRMDLSIKYVGVDSAKAMIDECRHRFVDQKNFTFLESDATISDLSNAGVVVCNYFLQFLKAESRQKLLKKIHNSLISNGILIISEKILEEKASASQFLQDLYFDFKKEQGYSDLEISHKRDALEKVLIPQTIQENTKLIQSGGFLSKDIILAIKWGNFATWIALKK